MLIIGPFFYLDQHQDFFFSTTELVTTPRKYSGDSMHLFLLNSGHVHPLYMNRLILLYKKHIGASYSMSLGKRMLIRVVRANTTGVI